MSPLRALVLLPLALLPFAAGCGGGDDEETTDEECTDYQPVDVTVTVLQPSGEPLLDCASIELDGVVCENAGDGTYDCVAEPDGNWQLSIVDTRFNAYSTFLVLTPECGKRVAVPHTAQLTGMMGS
jgi:hypothetical protein